MPNLPPRMSPDAANDTGRPRIDDFSFVLAIAFRTSARVAVPFAHAFVTAFTTTWAATYDGAPKYSPLPRCARAYARTIGLVGETGKNETSEPVILKVDGSKRPSEPNSVIRPLPAALSCWPKA